MEGASDRLTRRKIPTTLQAVERSKVPAWLLSLILHTFVLLSLALFWTTGPKGTGGEQGRPVGLAVVVDNAGKETYFLPSSNEQPTGNSSGSSGDSGMESLPESGGAGSALTTELQGLLPSTNSGGSGAATGDIGLGSGNSQLNQGGTPGKGVLHYSESMAREQDSSMSSISPIA